MKSVETLSEKLRRYFVQRDEIRLVYIFGSIAKGCANKLSDVDIAVFISEDSTKNYPYGYRAQIITDLMKILKTNNVDLVVLNRASPFLRFQVLRYGKLIFCRSKLERIRFQVKTFNEYNDTKRLVDFYFKENRKKLRQRSFTDVY
jgi:predicted nucleotidyltransferase